MDKFYAELCNPTRAIQHKLLLIEQMESYVDKNNPFTISDIQVKFGLGYQRACDLINYFVNDDIIIKNIGGQYTKLHKGITFNNLQGIN